MPQAGIDPPEQSHVSYEAIALPPKPPQLDFGFPLLVNIFRHQFQNIFSLFYVVPLSLGPSAETRGPKILKTRAPKYSNHQKKIKKKQKDIPYFHQVGFPPPPFLTLW